MMYGGGDASSQKQLAVKQDLVSIRTNGIDQSRRRQWREISMANLLAVDVQLIESGFAPRQMQRWRGTLYSLGLAGTSTSPTHPGAEEEEGEGESLQEMSWECVFNL